VIEKGLDPDPGGRVKHGALGDGKYGYEGKGKKKLENSDDADQYKNNENPGRHNPSSGLLIDHFPQHVKFTYFAHS